MPSIDASMVTPRAVLAVSCAAERPEDGRPRRVARASMPVEACIEGVDRFRLGLGLGSG